MEDVTKRITTPNLYPGSDARDMFFDPPQNRRAEGEAPND
jgi:hypothetical protein